MTRVWRLYRKQAATYEKCDWCGYEVWPGANVFQTLGAAHTACSTDCGEKLAQDAARREQKARAA